MLARFEREFQKTIRPAEKIQNLNHRDFRQNPK